MSFNVNYNAGGVIDEVKRIRELLGGRLDSIDLVKVIEKIENLERIGVVESLEDVKGGKLDRVEFVETVNEILGGVIDKVKVTELVENVEKVGEIRNFPTLTQPFNEMVRMRVPSLAGVYTAEYQTPIDEPVEILALTLTCSGYGEEDYYDLFCNNDQWFKNWYCSEVKEGLFLGTSTFVYKAEPGTKFKLHFHNVSGTSKTVWLGIRMLRASKTKEIE